MYYIMRKETLKLGNVYYYLHSSCTMGNVGFNTTYYLEWENCIWMRKCGSSPPHNASQCIFDVSHSSANFSGFCPKQKMH